MLEIRHDWCPMNLRKQRIIPKSWVSCVRLRVCCPKRQDKIRYTLLPNHLFLLLVVSFSAPHANKRKFISGKSHDMYAFIPRPTCRLRINMQDRAMATVAHHSSYAWPPCQTAVSQPFAKPCEAAMFAHSATSPPSTNAAMSSPPMRVSMLLSQASLAIGSHTC